MKAEHHGRCAPFALAARRGLLALALVAVWQVGHAAGFPGFMAKVTGKNTTVGTASNGTPIVTTGTGLSAGGGWQNAGNYGVAQGASGAVNVGGKGNVPVNGKSVPAEVTGTVSKTDIAAAVVGCATGGVVGCALAAVPLAIAWMNLSGARVNPETKQLELQDTTVCTMAPCFDYRLNTFGGEAWWPSAETACRNAEGLPADLHFYSVEVNPLQCRYSNADGSDTNYRFGLQTRSAPPKSPTWYPATPQEVKDALYKKDPAPGIVPELEKAGAGSAMPVGNPAITGPTTIIGPTTTTTNNIDNSVRTSTTTNTYNYAGSTVTNTGSTTTTSTTTSSGQTTESTTSTMNPGDEAPAEEPKETQCDKYPDTLGCAELDTPEGTIPKSTKEVSYTAESVWGGGSCPADKTWASQTLGQSYTLVPWAKACEWAVGMRAVVLLLAAWAAFWIVMPGNTQVKPQ